MSPLPQVTKVRKTQFLETLSQCANVTEACRRCDIAPGLVYIWRKRDKAFAARWEEAVERGTDALEDEAVRRAFEGHLEPVFHKGVQCGVVRKFSDSLLMFLLRARRPGRFRERAGQSKDEDLSIFGILKAIDGTTRGLPSERDQSRPTLAGPQEADPGSAEE